MKHLKIAALAAATALTLGAGAKAEEAGYVLATASTGGTYYPVGVALATISKAQLYDTEGISLSAISSAGSMENIKLLRDNQAQFAILQGIFVPWAWNGEGPISRPQPCCPSARRSGSKRSPGWSKR